MKKITTILLGLLFIVACNTPDPQQKNNHLFPSSAATRLADQQLEGYNNRDIDAFLIPYSDSVKVFYNLKQFAYQGKDKMRENYEGWFKELGYLHCEIVNRIASGNTVIDHEKVTFKKANGQEGNMEAMAIYKIDNGKIQEVYFTNP